MSNFVERFLEERRRLKLNQQELADAVGISKRSIGNYERGERNPDAEVLVKLGEVGVNVCYLLTGKRISTRLGLEPMQRAVLDDFDRCTHEMQIEAVRYMALLAEGAMPSAPSKQVHKSRTKGAEAKGNKSN